MTALDPADFYTGLVADLYSPLRSYVPAPESFASFVATNGEPALELGCGDGDPLLALRALGLDVDGVDSSADMLERLRVRADGLVVTVYQQRFEDLDLPRRYQSIFVAGATFNLLPSDEHALAALSRIRAHLLPDGTARIPLWIPPPSDGQGELSSAVDEDGAVIRVSLLHEDYDVVARTRRTRLFYERVRDGVSQTAEREWLLHWHTVDGFRALATSAGLLVQAVLDDDGARAGSDATAFTVLLRPAG
ncbi:trans-aconitate 2-methyltransferase [Cellulomonas sp. URHD0024]|uniref:class I SAM-dependent methyltransferase n=1 Tax=Cellulomonas sp. URHD0024 TaxID=1302620 RepID=UPI000409429F|nr:class I SAM-dependent methyltransferase [Cellulomonas sp. URHD0024]